VSLSAEGDLSLRANGGALRLGADRDVEVSTEGHLRLGAGEFTLAAREGTVAARVMSFVGERVALEADKVKTVARSLEQTLERFTQRVRNAVRIVQETDVLRAEQINHSADETYHLHARTAVVQSEKLVKVDGQSIQLG